MTVQGGSSKHIRQSLQAFNDSIRWCVIGPLTATTSLLGLAHFTLESDEMQGKVELQTPTDWVLMHKKGGCVVMKPTAEHCGSS